MVLCIYARKSSTVSAATGDHLTSKSKRFQQGFCTTCFDLLGSNIATFGFTPEKILCVDACGFSSVQKRPHEIVARKGKYQVGAVASGERGVNTTMVCVVSAAGVYILPMIIFKAEK
jgi:hypothetical protein